MTKPEKQGPFDHFMTLIGRMNYSWTNTESLLIHLIAGLVRTDKETAVVLFLTLNTTRARIDLVERLAKLASTPEEQRNAILPLTRKVVQLSGLRNHYNHSLYAFDAQTGAARTIQMRIADRKSTIKVGEARPIDDNTIAEIQTALEEITALNHDFWAVIERFGYPA